MSASDIVDAFDTRAGAVTDIIDTTHICDRAIIVLTDIRDAAVGGTLDAIIAVAIGETSDTSVRTGVAEVTVAAITVACRHPIPIKVKQILPTQGIITITLTSCGCIPVIVLLVFWNDAITIIIEAIAEFSSTWIPGVG